MKKAIFIPVQNRQQARNILRTDIITTLDAGKGVRIVIFMPDFKLDEYKKEFSGSFSNVVFEGVKDLPKFDSSLDKFFNRLSLSYIDTPTLRFMRRKWILLEGGKRLRYIGSMFLLLLLGNVRIFRDVSRLLDFYLVNEPHFGEYFDKYKPALVFSPNTVSRIDSGFLRQAKKRKIKTIGMINAWDNITLGKYPFRILPDKLIAYNDIIKKEAIKYLNMKEKNIYVSGWPHFDHYVNSGRILRDEYYRKLNINPSKKIILFASNGRDGVTEWQVLAMLDSAIKKGDLPSDVAIVVRHHPSHDMIRGDAEYSENVVFDNSKTSFKKERSYSEILTDDMNHLADSLFHSALIISTCSTMSIDASVFDKPIVNIAFDGWETKPFHQSIARAYTPHHMHYQPILKTGGVKIAYSFPEMVLLINRYLENQSLESEGRKRIVEEQCYKLDGKSGQRIGSYILDNLSKDK
jgi:hypothetical protein